MGAARAVTHEARLGLILTALDVCLEGRNASHMFTGVSDRCR